MVWNNVDQAKNKFCRRRLRAQEITKMSQDIGEDRGDHGAQGEEESIR